MTFGDVAYIVLAFIVGVPVIAAFVIMLIETLKHIIRDFINSLKG